MNATKWPKASAGALSLAALLSACAHELKPVAAEQKPGGPAYWESEIPNEKARGAPGSSIEGWKAQGDAGAPRPTSVDASSVPSGTTLPGTTDRFLWEPGFVQPETPASQIPLRNHEPARGDERNRSPK